jgi:hypothetical protein
MFCVLDILVEILILIYDLGWIDQFVINCGSVE